MRSIGRLLVSLSILAILHAAYSTYEYLSTLKALGRRTDSLPTSRAKNQIKLELKTVRRLISQIVVEALVALLLFLPGTALATASLQDVTYRGELARRTSDEVDSRLGFIPLGGGAKALPGSEGTLGT